MKKKAQLQIMENVFVLLIIFTLLAIAFIFVISMQKSDQEEKIQEFKELELVKKSQILNFLPELQCSKDNKLDPDCYDILKIEAFKDYLESDRLYYTSLLGSIKIDITQYDPSPETSADSRVIKTWQVYDNPKLEDKGERIVRFPVFLKDAVESSSYFGYIVLTVYE